MKRASQAIRAPWQFPATLHKHLNDYTLSAAAAGVAILALHVPAAAEIVYTPADQKIGIGHRLDLDLNHDGVVDFQLINYLHLSTTPFGDDLLIDPGNKFNGIVGGLQKNYYAAADLPAGIEVDRNRPFLRTRAVMAYASLTAFTYVSGGPWKSAVNRFLGLKFLINGEIHYGWARLSVLANKNDEEVRAKLTSYAYETVANQPIKTGETADGQINAQDSAGFGDPGAFLTSPAPNTPQLASLGMLARGAEGVPLWRPTE